MDNSAPLDASDIQVFNPEVEDDAANAMIETVWADAVLVAPCIKLEEFGDDSPELVIKVKSIIRGVVLRWADAGSGGVTQRGALDYSETLNGTAAGGKLRPDEIRDLQAICGRARKQQANTIPLWDTTRRWPTVHPFLTDTER